MEQMPTLTLGNTTYEVVDSAARAEIQRMKDSGVGGATGADGKSAYEIAVENGFEGTEAEWLASLKGADGADGESVNVQEVTESVLPGGENVVTFSDGKTLTVRNGEQGVQGKNGNDGAGIKSVVFNEDYSLTITTEEVKNGNEVVKPSVAYTSPTLKGANGYTPVKGVDYWNAEDKAEIEAHISAEVEEQLKSKAEGEVPSYTNQLPIAKDTDLTTVYNGVGYITDKYISSGYINNKTGYNTTGLIPIGIGSTTTANGEQVIYLKNIEALPTDAYVRVAFYGGDGSYIQQQGANAFKESGDDTASAVLYSADENGYIKSIDVTRNTAYLRNAGTGETAYFRICAPGIDGDSIITVNEVIAESSVKEGASALVSKALSREDSRIIRFLVSSDAHQKNDNELITKGSNELAQAHKAVLSQIGVDFVANLGDITWGSSESDNATVLEEGKAFNGFFLDSVRGQTSLWTEGNHETGMLTASQIYGLIYAHNKGLVQDTEHLIEGYGYMDFPNQKVRVICLNTNQGTASGNVEGMSNEQLEWFAEKALDMSDKTDWSVITLGHHPLSYNTVSLFRYAVETIKAFINGDDFSLTTNDGFTFGFNYGGKNCQYVGHFHGHAHAFSVVKMQRYVASNEYEELDAWEICIPNACYTRNNQYKDNGEYTERYSTETTYDKADVDGQRTSFNLVTVCLDEKKIYADNYGAGIDREISY